MVVSINSGYVVLNVLAIILGLAAILISAVKPGENAQAVRAVAVVGIFTMGVWLGLAAAVWAAVEFIFPHGLSISGIAAEIAACKARKPGKERNKV